MSVIVHVCVCLCSQRFAQVQRRLWQQKMKRVNLLVSVLRHLYSGHPVEHTHTLDPSHDRARFATSTQVRNTCTHTHTHTDPVTSNAFVCVCAADPSSFSSFRADAPADPQPPELPPKKDRRRRQAPHAPQVCLRLSQQEEVMWQMIDSWCLLCVCV